MCVSVCVFYACEYECVCVFMGLCMSACCVCSGGRERQRCVCACEILSKLLSSNFW
jgi:hypothetical protein